MLEKAFVVSPGFYWATVETPEKVCKGREATQELHTEVTVMPFKVYFAGVLAVFLLLFLYLALCLLFCHLICRYQLLWGTKLSSNKPP